MILHSHPAGQWLGWEKSPSHSLRFVVLWYPQPSAPQQDSRTFPTSICWEQALLLSQRMSISPLEHPQRRSLCAASKMVSYSAQHINFRHGCAWTAWAAKQHASPKHGAHLVPAQETSSQLSFPAHWLPQRQAPNGTSADMQVQQNPECTRSLWGRLGGSVAQNVLPSVYWQAQPHRILSLICKSLKMHLSAVKEGKLVV